MNRRVHRTPQCIVIFIFSRDADDLHKRLELLEKNVVTEYLKVIFIN